MTRAEVEQFIRHVYDIRLMNDAEKCASLFAPNSWFRIAGTLEINPVARADESIAGARQQISTMVRLWQWKSFDFRDVIIEGDRVVVHYSLTVLFNPTRETVDTEVVDLITVADRKIQTMLEFIDTAVVTRLGFR